MKYTKEQCGNILRKAVKRGDIGKKPCFVWNKAIDGWGFLFIQ